MGEFNKIEKAKKTRARKKRSERKNIQSDPEQAVTIPRNGPSRIVARRTLKRLAKMYGVENYEPEE